MVAELRLGAALDLVERRGPDDLVEFRHHLPGSELAQAAAALARWARGVLLSGVGEVDAAALDRFHELLALALVLNEDVRGLGRLGLGADEGATEDEESERELHFALAVEER